MSPDLISGLIGVILGFILTAAWQWWTEGKAAAEKRKNVRILLKAEITHNVERLKNVLASLSAPTKDDGPLGHTIIAEQLRGISFNVWNSETAELPNVLNGVELKQAISHYTNIAAALDGRDVILHAIQNRPRQSDNARHLMAVMGHERQIHHQVSAVKKYIELALDEYPVLK